MKGFLKALLVIWMASLGSSSRTLQQLPAASNYFNVLHYGAFGNGIKDDSNAFLAAWTAACGASSATAVIIPRGKTYLLSPLKFEGPCKCSTIIVQVSGKMLAPDFKAWASQKSHAWISFSNVDGLTVTGDGQFDGQGSSWWNTKKSDQERPTALHFGNCNNFQLTGLTHINSPKNHISIHNCNDVALSNLHIIAPEDSPNTDGIDISQSTNINIHDCDIGTGDDCIAINGGSANIQITSVRCGPGHGISVGSLGANGATDTVEEVHVRHCSFSGTMYGARIKTWQGGSGYARNISFEDITLFAAKNPIIINQFYCNGGSNCKNQTSAVQVSDITYDGFHGTSASEEAIQLSCSQTVGCRDIVLKDIDITSAKPNEVLSSSCLNAHGISTGSNPFVNCLSL